MPWNKTGNVRGPKGDTGAKGDPGVPAPFQVTGADAAGDKQLTLWTGSSDEYAAIATKNPSTVYVVRRSPRVYGTSTLRVGVADFDIMPHKPGDIIVVHVVDAMGGIGMPFKVPPAGGAVPDWKLMGSYKVGAGSNYGDASVYWARATSSSHDSGNWVNIGIFASYVFSGNPTGVGAIAGNGQWAEGGPPANLTCPALDLQDKSGNSEVVHSVVGLCATGIWSPVIPAGYRQLMKDLEPDPFTPFAVAVGKNDTTSAGAINLGTASAEDALGVSRISFEVTYK